MRVWWRVLVGYLVLVGGILLLGMVGIRSTREVRHRFHVVNRESVPLLMHLSGLRDAAHSIVSSTTDYALVNGSGGADGKEALAPDKAEKKRLLRQGFGSYRSELAFCARLMRDPQEQALLAKVRGAGTRLLTVARNLILLRDLHPPAQRVLDATEELQGAEASFLEAVNAAVEFERGDGEWQNWGGTTGTLVAVALAASISVAGMILRFFPRRFFPLDSRAQEPVTGNSDEVLIPPHDGTNTAILLSEADLLKRRELAEIDSLLATGGGMAATPETGGIVFPKLTT